MVELVRTSAAGRRGTGGDVIGSNGRSRNPPYGLRLFRLPGTDLNFLLGRRRRRPPRRQLEARQPAHSQAHFPLPPSDFRALVGQASLFGETSKPPPGRGIKTQSPNGSRISKLIILPRCTRSIDKARQVTGAFGIQNRDRNNVNLEEFSSQLGWAWACSVAAGAPRPFPESHLSISVSLSSSFTPPPLIPSAGPKVAGT